MIDNVFNDIDADSKVFTIGFGGVTVETELSNLPDDIMAKSFVLITTIDELDQLRAHQVPYKRVRDHGYHQVNAWNSLTSAINWMAYLRWQHLQA